MNIEVCNLTKKFGSFTAVNDVSLNVRSGELVSLLGPSGSGKTTLLRIIAGLEVPDSGSIIFNGEDTTNLCVKDRKVGFVFQHYALFRHMTVFANVAFGLSVLPRKIRPTKDEIKERVMALLNLVQIDYMADRYPSQLSGGQRQRVALARALAIEPKLLLLDEPFGALDAKVRKELRKWLRRLHDEIHLTSVFVTHDQEEALEVSDSVVVMNEGAIVQTGPPDYVYEHPSTPFVFQFFGNVNLFHARMVNGQTNISEMEIDSPEHYGEDNMSGVAYVRPHDIEICKTPNNGQGVKAIINHISKRGAIVHLELNAQSDSELFDVELSRNAFRNLKLQEGDTVYAIFRNPKIFGGMSKFC